MANPAIAIDRLETLEVGLKFPAKIAFDGKLAGGDRLNDLAELFRAQIFRADVGIDIDLLEDALRGARANAIDIRERRFDTFVAWNFNA